MKAEAMTDADLIDAATQWPAGPFSSLNFRAVIDKLSAALEERGAQLEQALRERSPCRKCSGRGYTLAYDGITRKQCESCNGSKMELRLVDRLDTVTALSQRQAETIETLRTDLADVEANAEMYKAQRDRLREALAAILKHQQVVGGDLRNMSTIATIARAALEPKS